MKTESILDNLLEKNILCNKCSNIPLLGIEFLNESKNISDIIKLHSFCIFHNNKRAINELLINNIYKEKEEDNKKEKNIKIKCEYCRKNKNDYLCVNCKRNICKECLNFHKSHKIYENNKYLISKDDFIKIENKFKSAKKNFNKNLIYIRSKIDIFKSELQKLENLYKDYKDINDKLIALANFILKKYKNGIISGNCIYYPIYFNVKNVLEFNFQEFKIKDDDFSIKSFTNYFLDRIRSGSFFLLSDSKYNKNLNDYTNQKLIKIDTLKFDEFKEIKVEYSKFIFLENKTKLIGIKKDSNLLEVFNIQNKSVETSIKLDSKVRKFKIFLKDNILLLITNLEIYIFNSKTFSIIQSIKLKEDNEKFNKHHQFIYGEIISKDSIGIIYEGDLGYLFDHSLINNYISLPLNKYGFLDIINKKEIYMGLFEKESHKFVYFLIYKKNGFDNFNLEKIILLLKKHIVLGEIGYVSYKHFEVEDDITPYCTFYFDSLNRTSDTEFVIAFKSRIKEQRNQYNFYITDKNYSNETIYYYLNINDNFIERQLCSTKENSFLSKIDNTFYFLFNELDDYSELKKMLKHYKFTEIKMDEVNLRDFYYQNKTILGWDNELIYLGKIYSNNKLEIIKTINKYKNNKIINLCLNPNIIFYDNLFNYFEELENSEDIFIEEE